MDPADDGADKLFLGIVKVRSFLVLDIDSGKFLHLFQQTAPAQLQTNGHIAAEVMDLTDAMVDVIGLDGRDEFAEIVAGIVPQLPELLQNAEIIAAHGGIRHHYRREGIQHFGVVVNPATVAVEVAVFMGGSGLPAVILRGNKIVIVILVGMAKALQLLLGLRHLVSTDLLQPAGIQLSFFSQR